MFDGLGGPDNLTIYRVAGCQIFQTPAIAQGMPGRGQQLAPIVEAKVRNLVPGWQGAAADALDDGSDARSRGTCCLYLHGNRQAGHQ